MPRNLSVLIVFFVLSVFVAGQAPSPSPAASAEDEAELRAGLIALLRETSTEVSGLRTLENRISFNSELASLMWFHDEREARAMYSGVISEFNQLLMQLDAQASMPAVEDEDSIGGFFGGRGTTIAARKLRIAMGVRRQIAMSLAEHVPDLAYSFFVDSLGGISNPELRKEAEGTDSRVALQILEQVAARDVSKAAELGKESVKKGVDSTHISLLKKIYAKDADKGIDFGASILSRLKNDPSNVDVHIYGELLSFGDAQMAASKKPDGKKPVYGQSELRDLAEQLAKILLASDDGMNEYLASSNIEYIEKYAPGRVSQLRVKYKSLVPAAKRREPKGSNGIGIGNVEPAGTPEPESEDAAREKAQKKLIEDINGLSNNSLSKEGRDKVVAQSREIIARTSGKEKKIIALSMLAAQVARAGDLELAQEIMRDAERFVDPYPKNIRDFGYTLMLISGYAQADPNRAFRILDDAIRRANDTIAAAVKIAEFIDVSEDIVVDGELQVGMFGNGMMRSMTSELGAARTTIQALIKADLGKTRDLTNSFDRAESRILSKMMVLRAGLDNGKNKGDAGDSEADKDDVDMLN